MSDTTIAQMSVLSLFNVKKKSDLTQQSLANYVDVMCDFHRVLFKHVKPNYLHVKEEYKLYGNCLVYDNNNNLKRDKHAYIC